MKGILYIHCLCEQTCLSCAQTEIPKTIELLQNDLKKIQEGKKVQ